MLGSMWEIYKNNLLLYNVIGLILIIILILAFLKFKKLVIHYYQKYKEIINYIIIGFFSTIVSIGSYAILRIIIPSYTVNTILSWVIVVTFSYYTTRHFVFNSQAKKVYQEVIKFFLSRIITLLLELALMYILIDLFKIDDLISKIMIQFIVIALNYVLSKIFVFNKKKET